MTPFMYAYNWDAASNRYYKFDGANTTNWYYDARNLPYLEYDQPAGGPNTATYYSYDQSQRMTQFASPTDARYFAYNQRNMVTGLFNASATPDAPRYFAYSGIGERLIVMNDSYGASLNVADPPVNGPAYWAYDGRKLILDAFFNGSITYFNFYRHNQSGQGRWDFLEHQRRRVYSYPAHDAPGSVKQLQAYEDGITTTTTYLEYTRSGDTIEISPPTQHTPNRTRFTGLVRLQNSMDMDLRPLGALRIVRLDMLLVPSGLRLPGDFRNLAPDILRDERGPVPFPGDSMNPDVPPPKTGIRPRRPPQPPPEPPVPPNEEPPPPPEEPPPPAPEDLVFILYAPHHGWPSDADDQSGYIQNGVDTDPLSSWWVTGGGTTVPTFERMFEIIRGKREGSIRSITICVAAQFARDVSGCRFETSLSVQCSVTHDIDETIRHRDDTSIRRSSGSHRARKRDADGLPPRGADRPRRGSGRRSRRATPRAAANTRAASDRRRRAVGREASARGRRG